MAQLHTLSLARTAALATSLALLTTCAPAWADAEDPYIGALMPMAGKTPGGTCPKGWLPADGRLLHIQSYTALYSLLGVSYGGDGQNTFGLPDLRGRTAVGVGQGPGLSQLDQGEQGGNDRTTLLLPNLPAHNLAATTVTATHAAPDATRTLAQAQNAGLYASGGTPVTLAQSGVAGQSQPVPTMSPYLTIIWCIATQGAFPPRP